jgi:hypothetical protein
LGAQQSTITLSYTNFLQQVDQGNVKDMTLTGHAVSGDFKTPLQQPQSGTSSTTTYARFTSYVPETGDPTLLPTLEKNGVQVTAQPVQTPWWQTALTILLNALPFLLLVYFGYMAMRSIRQSQQGGGIFGVGRSRAKLYTEERPSTPSPMWQEPTKPRPTCARISSSYASRSATPISEPIFPKACCWSAHRGPAKPCSLVPSPVRQASRSSAPAAPTSSNSSPG